MYKQHLNVFTNRRNTVNGRLYREDPTIFYWDLINEPRWCASACCKMLVFTSRELWSTCSSPSAFRCLALVRLLSCLTALI